MTSREPIDELGIDELQRMARQLLDAGRHSQQLEIALEQLIADRTNGEALDEPAADLRAAVAKALADELSIANDDPPV